MKKEYKFLAFFAIGLFAVSFFAGLVAAQNPVTNAISKISDLFGGNINSFQDFVKAILVPEVLFGILIFLVIFTIIDKISLFGVSGQSNWVKTTISIIIAILAGGFVDSSIYLGIINQYSALGILISFYLPFILLYYFLKEIAPQNSTVQGIVWWTYTVFVGISAWINWNAVQASDIPTLSKWLYWIMVLASIGMAIFHKKIMHKMFINELKAGIDENEKKNLAILSTKEKQIAELILQTQKGTEEYELLKKQRDEYKKLINAQAYEQGMVG